MIKIKCNGSAARVRLDGSSKELTAESALAMKSMMVSLEEDNPAACGAAAALMHMLSQFYAEKYPDYYAAACRIFDGIDFSDEGTKTRIK